jgi:hypothetical protein
MAKNQKRWDENCRDIINTPESGKWEGTGKGWEGHQM